MRSRHHAGRDGCFHLQDKFNNLGHDDAEKDQQHSNRGDEANIVLIHPSGLVLMKHLEAAISASKSARVTLSR